jgi:hypothetical protein
LSADDLHIMNAPTEEGDDPGAAEQEEEQFGLIPLLQQMSLSELREIARQRGWRVKGASKADYVSALASLLCDPTETARAVTGMPENLREALRAAFVADDGGGITPTTMAQTMTALRGAGGPRIKPVEAAALLIDLARWGLVLPWRDSLYDQGRHVLPWRVQRLLPPLSGWCPTAAQAPATPMLARDARQCVNSLYAVWENIAEESPALLPAAKAPDGGVPAERLTERHLQSLLQGWPYDPEELQGWAGARRRAEAAAQSLSVPPPRFLIEEAALPTLARLSQGKGPAAGDDEELEFVCRLLCELGLVSVQNDHLLAQRGQMARFLRRSVANQHRAVAQAYLSLLDWSELDLLLRRDRHLSLWHKPYFSIPYDQFRSWLVRLRHLLLRFLASAGEEGWCRLTDMDAALRKLWPHFQSALQGERESWLSQAWGLAWHQEVREPDTVQPPPQRAAEHDPQSRLAENAGQSTGPTRTWQHLREGVTVDWEASQGALLRVMLEGPLYWLGFAELSYGDGPAPAGTSLDPAGSAARPEWGAVRLAAVRLHGLANWIWDRPAARFDLEGSSLGEAVTIDEAAGTISIRPGSVAPETHTFLGRIARLEEASPESFLYHLHPRAALATFESGASLSDLLAEWERVMPQAIPSALQQTLSQWWTLYGQVRLYNGFGLLELRDEVTLRELEAGTSLSQHIVGRLSPRIVLVPDDAVDGLLREFAAKGYTPKKVD